MWCTNIEADSWKMFWKLHSNYPLPWLLTPAAGELMTLETTGLQHWAGSFLFECSWRSKAEPGRNMMRLFHLPAKHSCLVGRLTVGAEQWLRICSRRLLKFQWGTLWKMTKCHSLFLLRIFLVKITLLFPTAVCQLYILHQEKCLSFRNIEQNPMLGTGNK